MAGRSVDVSLVIKAIDQSKSALDTVATSLAGVNVAQRAVASGSGDVNKSLDNLLKNLEGLGNVSKTLDTGLRNSVQGYSQQTAALQAANAAIDERKRKIADLERTEAKLESLQGTFKTRMGKDVSGPRIPSLSGVQSSLGTERSKLERDQQSVDAIIGNIARATQGIRETKAAQFEVGNAIKTVIQRYDELTIAATRAGAAQKDAAVTGQSVAQRINELTGVNNTGTLKSFRNQRQIDLENTFAPKFAADDAATLSATNKAAAEAASKAAGEAAAKAAEEVKQLASAEKAAAEAAKEMAAAAKQEADALATVKQYARDVSEALDPAAKTTRLLAEEQDRLSAAVKVGALSQGQADAAMSKYRNEVTGVTAAQRAEVRETERLTASMAELKRQIDPAAAAEEYLTRKTQELDKALKAGILTQAQYAKGLAHITAQSNSMKDNKSVSLFGLRPYETQNLMFQFNDIATQLASGTSLTQTLSQQGGQILQLFPKIGNAIVGLINPFTVFAAVAVGGFALLVNHALDAEARMRSFSAAIMGSANAAGETAQGLFNAAEALRDYGIAAEDADKITKKLFREGFNGQQIIEFTGLARDMSVVLGTDLNSNLDLLTQAYAGNYASLEKLIDASGNFSNEQKNAIRALYETGDAAGATDRVFRQLSGSFDGAAKKSESEWTKATRNLGNAWRDFMDMLSKNYVVTAVTISINALADAMNYLSGATNKATKAGGGSLSGGNGAGVGGVGSATAAQKANNTKLTAAQKRTEILGRKVTSQAIVEEKLGVLANDFNLEYGKQLSAQDLALRRTNQLRIERNKLEADLLQFQKQQSDQQKRAAEQAQREAERREKEQNTALFQAMALLRNKEGFRSKSYFDVNAYRVGYGSDTVTSRAGTVSSVTPNTRVDRAGAERDLQRRVNELIDVIKKRIGGERFGDFSATQQGAIVSLYYNYGKNADRIKKDLEPLLETGTNEQIAAMVRSFANDRPFSKNGKAINFDRRMAEAAILAQPNLSVDQGAQEAAEDAQKKLADFNTALDEKLSKEERSVEYQKELVGLQGEELIKAKQRQAVQEALLQATEDLRDVTKDPNANLSEEQKTRITTATSSQFDAQFITAARDTLQGSLDDLLALRDTIQEQIRSETERGNTNVVNALETQLDTVNGKLLTAADSLRKFLTMPGNAEALGITSAQLDTILMKLEAATAQTGKLSFEFGGVKLGVDEIANAFTNGAVNAINQFAQAVGNGKNAFNALLDSFRQFAADFMIQIAQMIQKQIIFNLVSGILKGLTMDAGITNMFAANPGIFHDGGIAGQATKFTTVHPAVFANAARYHSGGIAGLKPGEVPAVLMQGEEVLTRKDPRHMMNGGGGGRGDVKIVNAFDEGDVISKAMNTRAGEKAILNLVRSNPRAFKAAMSGG